MALTKHKLKSTPFFPPYSPVGNYNLKTTGAGVYIIKEKNVIVYVGMSGTHVQNTLYRHFQQWNDLRTNWTKKKEIYERVSYYGRNRGNFMIKVIFTPTEREARILEELLILKLKPKDNTLKLSLYSNNELKEMSNKFESAESWKLVLTENPF